MHITRQLPFFYLDMHDYLGYCKMYLDKLSTLKSYLILIVGRHIYKYFI